MRQQEEKLRAKYGDLKPKKKLIHKVRASERAAETKKTPNPLSRGSSMLLLRRERAARSSLPAIVHADLPRSRFEIARARTGCQILRLRGLLAAAGTRGVRCRRSRPSARKRRSHPVSFFAPHSPEPLSSSRAQQDKEHHRGEEDVRTLPVKMGSSPPKSNMSK
jgi:hypothetical protein